MPTGSLSATRVVPVRGFSRSMPAFGGAFSVQQLQLIMDHLRTFCTDKDWAPR